MIALAYQSSTHLTITSRLAGRASRRQGGGEGPKHIKPMHDMSPHRMVQTLSMPATETRLLLCPT